MDVLYCESSFFPGVLLFRCERLHADLSAACCARNFSRAASLSCVACPVGKHHAEGLSVDPQPDVNSRWVSRTSGRCVRCARHALRLVRGHTICVSCYNREREVLHGANAKGSRPVKASGLRQAHVDLLLDGRRWIAEIGMCSGQAEVERTAQRCWPGCVIKSFSMDVDLPKLLPPSRTACRA